MADIDAQLTLLRKNIAELEEKKRLQKLAELEEKNKLLKQFTEIEKKNQIKFDSFLPDKHDYQRMQDMNEDYEDMAYEDFILWNLECLRSITVEDRGYLMWMCKKIRSNNINLVDMEACSSFTANGFYFDKESNLCIVNPR
jgi:hypothetical protein